MSLTHLFPAGMMLLGEVELHVCDIPEPGRGGLLFAKLSQLNSDHTSWGGGKRKRKRNGLTAYVKFNGGGWFLSVMFQSKPGFTIVFPPKRETFFGGAVNVIHCDGWRGPGKTPVMFV